MRCVDSGEHRHGQPRGDVMDASLQRDPVRKDWQSYVSPTDPIEAAMPAFSKCSASVKDVYCEPASE